MQWPECYDPLMITMTDACAQHLEKMAQRDKVSLIGVRIAVVGGGCSGLSYDIDFENEQRDEDTVFGEHPKIFIDPKSLSLVEGLELDITTGMVGTGFVFRNPKATQTCGCGTSFSV